MKIDMQWYLVRLDRKDFDRIACARKQDDDHDWCENRLGYECSEIADDRAAGTMWFTVSGETEDDPWHYLFADSNVAEEFCQIYAMSDPRVYGPVYAVAHAWDDLYDYDGPYLWCQKNLGKDSLAKKRIKQRWIEIGPTDTAIALYLFGDVYTAALFRLTWE